MKLYFFRHGLAEDRHPSGDDTLRALTKEGIRRTRTAARVLDALGVRPARLYTSPYLRARQTADLLADVLKCEVEERAELAPGFSLQAVEALTAPLGDGDDVLFVGHEPDFSRVVSGLCGGGQIIMKRGGFARVDLISRRPPRGALVWLIAPKVFNRLQ